MLGRMVSARGVGGWDLVLRNSFRGGCGFDAAAAVQHNAHALRTPKHGGFDVVKSSRRRFEGARGGVMAQGGWGGRTACSLAPGGELAKLSSPSVRVFSTRGRGAPIASVTRTATKLSASLIQRATREVKTQSGASTLWRGTSSSCRWSARVWARTSSTTGHRCCTRGASVRTRYIGE